MHKHLLLRDKRHLRIRQRVIGTAARPRMSVRFTNQHIYVQFIDDAKGVTLAAASTRSKALPDREKLAANAASAKRLGAVAAEAAKAAGIRQVVFDRGGASITAKSKPWPTPRARRACSFNRQENKHRG
jgi:large subunit ribosomal protein L18